MVADDMTLGLDLDWESAEGGRERIARIMLSKDVMQTNVVTVDPEVRLADAARTLVERKIGWLQVVEGDELVGILTEGDFLALLAVANRATG